MRELPSLRSCALVYLGRRLAPEPPTPRARVFILLSPLATCSGIRLEQLAEAVGSGTWLKHCAEALEKKSTMTVRRWNDNAAGTQTFAPVVLILKKTQGSVWSEAGRTPLCPTLSWLRDNYGVGQYELRLEQGNRTLCMTKAVCSSPLPPGSVTVTPAPATGPTRSWPASGTERAPAKTGLRGTALG